MNMGLITRTNVLFTQGESIARTVNVNFFIRRYDYFQTIYKSIIKMNITKFSNNLNLYKQYLAQRIDEIAQGNNNYSLLNSLLSPYDEVQLHTRFIYSMINPVGTHFQSIIFLESFLKEIDPNILKFFDLYSAVVYKEKNHIDLLIDDGKTAIIIENKLRAADQYQQISRYISCIRASSRDPQSKRIIVVYLTMSGRDPQQEASSFGDYKLDNTRRYLLREIDNSRIDYYAISYKETIVQWVNKSRKEVEKHENLAYAFDEYLSVLNRVNKKMSKNNVINFPDFVLNQKNEDTKDYLEFAADMIKNFHVIWARYLLTAIYSIENFEPVFIKGDDANKHNALVIVDNDDSRAINKLTKWLEKKEHKGSYKNIAVHFKGTHYPQEHYAIYFGIDNLYVGRYKEHISEIYNDTGKHKYLVNNKGLLRKILQDPNKIKPFLAEFTKRISSFLI